MRPEQKGDQTSPSTAAVRNTWSFSFSASYVFIKSYLKKGSPPLTVAEVGRSKRWLWTRHVVQEGNEKCICSAHILSLLWAPRLSQDVAAVAGLLCGKAFVLGDTIKETLLIGTLINGRFDDRRDWRMMMKWSYGNTFGEMNWLFLVYSCGGVTPASLWYCSR